MTFVFKYLFGPIVVGTFLVGILSAWDSDDTFIWEWSRGAALMVALTLPWLVIIMARLRRVEANEQHIAVKTFSGNQIIEYKNIEWLYEIALNPILISVKYRDPQTGDSKKILMMPSAQRSGFKAKKEHAMTQYVRKQVLLANPNYSRESEPSKWVPAGLILLTIVVVNLLFHFVIRS